MKFEESFTTSAQLVAAQTSSDVVRWTHTEHSSTSDGSCRRKSAKCSPRRGELSLGMIKQSAPMAQFQPCCSLTPCDDERHPKVHGSDGQLPCGGSGSSRLTTRSLASSTSRWHRCQLVVLYIVALVLVGAISVVHCDAVSRSSSNSRQPYSNVADDAYAAAASRSVTEDLLDASGHYTHHWAVHIPNGGDETAELVAAEHEFINHGKILDGFYHFEHRHVQKRSANPSAHHQRRLDADDRVQWAQQQRVKRRVKRDFRPLKSPYLIQLNDPKWPEMWYLNRGNGLDMNVIPAWKEGVTGKGVVVTILDDGLESDHPDLEHNYDPKASYDVNGNDGDPMPHYDLTDSNRHGTRCAGEVAATANNSKCAVGIAYGARVGGVRMLDGDVTDVVEAKSLGLNSQHIDIYSASWGPDDDGKTVDGPGDMATRAFIEGVRKGRGGKGSIFIWASGNGGREHDNCNCDGYTNSIWTLSISSASQEGLVPWFSEMCSSTLATTYSSGNTNEKQVITTDLHHSCTSSHTGTSASAPLAAGIAALVLEANRNLTWRDLQHIVVRTAKPGNLKDPTWSKNGIGRRVSHSFGYGLMDAASMVKLARTWKTVPEQQVCEINAPHLDKQIPPRTKVTLQLTVEHCMGVNYLEHVQAKITLTSQRRGDIQIFLTSPSGTRVTLLTPRSHDLSRSGFNQWPFMSVHTWGEAPHGTWQLEIHNEGRLLGYSLIRGWSLILYGTSTPPDSNDPPNASRVFSTPSPALPPIIPAYSVGGSKTFYSTTGALGKPNRKQQLQYATYTPNSQFGITPVYQVTPARKNNKNKNKLNKNSTKNTTARPSSQTTLNGFHNPYGNGKKYEYNTGIKKTATPKPKPFIQSINYRNEKYHAATSNGYEKQIAIKAPKQVKDNGFQTPSKAASRKPIATGPITILPINFSTSIEVTTTSAPTTQSSFLNERFSTTNGRIPKLFQQYEKIQQFYPELKPYSSIRDDMERPKQQPPQSPFESESGPHGNPSVLFSGGTNGKPSRANTKIFFPDTDIIDAIGPRKITSSLQPIQQPFYGRTQNSQFVSSGSKSGKAQITQWNLIFYGTEAPAQPDDPVRLGKPSFSDNNYGGEIEHNSLEFDSGITSDQWRNMQQIGESHVDVQRTASNDVTSLACSKYTLTRCIVCGSSSYFFNGRCYSSCPTSTFPSNSSTDPANDPIREAVFTEQKPLPAGSLRRRSAISFRLVANGSDNFNNLDDIRRAAKPQERDTLQSQHYCLQCHPTCLSCIGSEDYQCTECQPEFAFADADAPRSNHQQRCVSINGKRHQQLVYDGIGTNNFNSKDRGHSEKFDKSSYFTNYLLMITVVGTILLVAFAVIYMLWRRCFRGTTTVQYNRVQTYEVVSEPSFAELLREEIDEILAESSNDELNDLVDGGIIAPMER
ncbi:furin-like protease 1 isoform X1 [Toxorhynchites rutilus septentrionalis]|uniref:furin-like protease 1 isoform X1 n=1 Tax=Toxorhynchites rutilus septentrionalis TaxID=329112 RepID=UPI0024794975|nr:furin-like protease 1 isoform X1 [Toxorhynchites rutilus septentrionalis]XP_055642451.1 furin-like protease 1 isoform X1 [Toxorhynchites rutilus septentrionalis]